MFEFIDKKDSKLEKGKNQEHVISLKFIFFLLTVSFRCNLRCIARLVKLRSILKL